MQIPIVSAVLVASREEDLRQKFEEEQLKRQHAEREREEAKAELLYFRKHFPAGSVPFTDYGERQERSEAERAVPQPTQQEGLEEKNIGVVILYILLLVAVWGAMLGR